MSERNKRLPSTFGLNGFDSDSELDFYSEASKPEKKSDQTNVSFFLGDARVFPFAPERDLRTVNDLVDSFSNVPEGKLTCPADHLIDVWITSISEVVASKSLPKGSVFDLSVGPIALKKQQDNLIAILNHPDAPDDLEIICLNSNGLRVTLYPGHDYSDLDLTRTRQITPGYSETQRLFRPATTNEVTSSKMDTQAEDGVDSDTNNEAQHKSCTCLIS
jgi:hypothetical protein